MSFEARDICTVILAGGRGRRMQGQDKGLLLWQGRPLIEHVMDALHSDPQRTLISANRNLQRYRQYGLPVISDELDDFQGPLAGMLAAMRHCSADYLLCLPCDSPQPPDALPQRLHRCMVEADSQLAICHDGQRQQPLFALLAMSVQPALEQYLVAGHRKVQDFFAAQQAAICDFSDQADRFRNFNSPEDMQ
jgi:molybdenum cofactor guanylyltransferase